MLSAKAARNILIGFAISGSVAAAPAQGAAMVTYSWTTTSVGFGAHAFAPTSATFQVPLSNVLNGVISQFDITNVQLSYPGLSFDNSAVSSIGFDFSAFVDPVTGAFIYHDDNQGLAVIAFKGTDINSATTFLSITVGAVGYDSGGQPLNIVKDQFNALDNGAPDAGFPTAGFWTATFPEVTGSVPEPSTWALAILGFGATGLALRRRQPARTG